MTRTERLNTPCSSFLFEKRGCLKKTSTFYAMWPICLLRLARFCVFNYFLLLIYLSVNIFYTGRQCKLLSNKESLVISHWIQKTILWNSDMAGLHYKRIQYAEDERQERSMIMNGNVGTCHVYSKNCKRGYSHVNFPHSSVDKNNNGKHRWTK